VQRLCRETGTAMMWITHDLAVVSGLADRIAVMYAGRIVESGATADVIGAPSHPYTRGLIDSIPTRATHGTLLRQIPGMTPSLLNLPQGCAFRPRCGHATDACLAVPQAEPGPAGKTVRCWNLLTTEPA
jgi:peptide/nickel transport system ATP-binding protein